MDKATYETGMRMRREVLWHAAVYAGVPAAMDAFRVARDVLQEAWR